MRHQECFALKCDDGDLMTVLRTAFLRNVDDIYQKADEYAEVHGIQVQVRHSTTRGYFLAVPFSVGIDLPQVFLHPTKSGNRSITCTTEEIASLNTRAQDNMHDLLLMTHDRIQEVLEVARCHYDAVAALCDAVALLDLCHSFADKVTLSRQPWCRPVVVESLTSSASASATQITTTNAGGNASGTQSTSSVDPSDGALMIRKGRFAIDVSQTGLPSSDDSPTDFVPNDTYIPHDKPFAVITGINGSGKSTYLKQVAMIVILAQCGSYVPAEQASIPIRDQLLCRIGNADDQEHNLSTFLLEMKETAFICSNAKKGSLVLVDELGRATSNEDGVAIAWATSEYLLKKHAITIFVTH
jgi:DNA mismatch repair protein MSH4